MTEKINCSRCHTTNDKKNSVCDKCWTDLAKNHYIPKIPKKIEVKLSNDTIIEMEKITKKSRKINKSRTNLYFGYKWRISRSSFWFSKLILFFILLAGINIILFAFFFKSWTSSAQKYFWWLLSILFCAIFIYSNYVINVKRLHDLWHAWWSALWAFLPGVSLILTIYLWFFQWTKGINKYWENPIVN